MNMRGDCHRRAKLLVWAVVTVLATSCATGRGSRPGQQSGLLNTKAEGGLFNLSPSTASRTPKSIHAPGEFDREILGIQLTNRDFDIPVEWNPEVEHWVEYFTGSGRKHFAVYLERKARMEPIILPKLKDAGMPQDLIYLAMIESGFSTAATSHAGAVGPWQFMRATGRMYGLQSDWWRDERRDPERSTEAAVAYLGRLYEEFKDWRLACAAYNSGEGRIRNGISKLGTRDFWVIARHKRALRRETKDYVPKMMAAAIIGKNAEQFGFRTAPADSSLVEYEKVKIPRVENLRAIARAAEIDFDRLAELNPELLRCCTPPIGRAYALRVPKGPYSQKVLAAVEEGSLGRYAGFRRHVIRRGDTLSAIAKRSGVPTEAILALNDVRSVRSLKLGAELIVPERYFISPKSEGRVLASTTARKAKKGEKSLTHVVQQGDTLYGISRRYAVRMDDLRRWNPASRGKSLRPGSQIKLYVKNEVSDQY